MSNLNKFRKSTVAILTALLLIAIAAPLASFAVAATNATVSISPISGPNGTAVKVTGSGFAASDTVASFTITVNGITGKVITTGAGLNAAYELATSATGVIKGAGATSGYIIIGGSGAAQLAPGTYSIQISDGSAAPQAVTFTVTAPTVTFSPSSGPAGTSVLVQATGYPTSVVSGATTIYDASTNYVTAATYAGTAITTVASGVKVTSSPTTLSSSIISATTGAFTATVTLPLKTTLTSSAFTLTDNLGNVGTGTFSTSGSAITVSPTSGVPGTLVTVTATGFGPGIAFAGAQFDTTPTLAASLKPANPTTTEQGTGVFQFTIPASGILAGTHTITVADVDGNSASASFTVTPKVTLTLGDGTIDSTTANAPTGVTAGVYLAVTGFAKSAPLTITGSPGVPTAWLTFGAGLTTSATGDVVATWSSTATAPAAGVYSITVSDGTNTISTLITIASSGTFFVITPATAAVGSTVSLIGFGADSTAIKFDSATIGATQCDSNAWPNPPSTVGSFAVPSSGAGAHTISTTGITGTATFTTTAAPSISIVNPTSATGGTTVTIVGSGFANVAGVALSSLTIDGITPTASAATFTQGQMIATFTMPAFLAGAHTIVVADTSSNTASASVNTLTPSVSVSPSSGVVGTSTAKSISITGSSFPAGIAGQAITVQFDGITLPAATVGCQYTNLNGGIILYTTAIPANTAVRAGAHTITVSAGTVSATTTFTVNPTISIPAPAVRAGPTTSVTISGNGFSASSSLTLLINGTATTWYQTTAPYTNSSAVTSDASGNVPINQAVLIPASIASGSLNITVVDASGYAASRTLTVLADPSITLAATQTIAGAGIVPIGIAGAGFTPNSVGQVAQVDIMNAAGDTIVVGGAQTAGTVVVSNAGTFANTLEGVQVTSAALVAGTYTVKVTLGTTLSPPVETATATLTVLGAPTVTLNTESANIGANVTINIVGMQNPTLAVIGSTSILAGLDTTTVPTTGANAYDLTTWFLVPAGITAGTYTVQVSDGTRFATTTITIGSAITLTPAGGLGTPIIKGSIVNIAGTGFGPSAAFTVKVNGVTAATGTTTAGGAVTSSFTVPITATSTNTVTVTDVNGNTASATFTLTPPVLSLTPETGATGSTIQIIGSGFTASASAIIQIGGIVATTAPSTINTDASGAFIAYATVPAGLSGNQTVTVIDTLNNVGTAYFVVGSVSGTGTPSQTTMSSTAQTTTSSGTAATTFAAGSTVKAGFMLQSTSGSRDVVVAVTWQQGAKVYNMASFQTTMTTTASPVSFSNLIPAGATGTWTATLQVFAVDGVTPLGVTTLTFTVS